MSDRQRHIPKEPPPSLGDQARLRREFYERNNLVMPEPDLTPTLIPTVHEPTEEELRAQGLVIRGKDRRRVPFVPAHERDLSYSAPGFFVEKQVPRRGSTPIMHVHTVCALETCSEYFELSRSQKNAYRQMGQRRFFCTLDHAREDRRDAA